MRRRADRVGLVYLAKGNAWFEGRIGGGDDSGGSDRRVRVGGGSTAPATGESQQ